MNDFLPLTYRKQKKVDGNAATDRIYFRPKPSRASNKVIT